MTRTLITTSLEASWPEMGPCLFLGEWCKRYSRRDRWSAMDGITLPYHWDDRVQFEKDYWRLQSTYERLLPQLAAMLNEIHQERRSLRYWRILVGPWLNFFIHIVFDRFQSIQQAFESFAIDSTIAIVPDEAPVPVCDMEELAREMTGDLWNHRLYLDILRRVNPSIIRWKYTLAPPSDEPSAPKSPPQRRPPDFLQRQLRRAKAVAYALARRFSKNDKYFLFLTNLSEHAEAETNLRLGQLPKRWPAVAGSKTCVNGAQRQWHIEVDSTPFGDCLAALIPWHLPTSFLEGYRQTLEATVSAGWPSRPGVIFTSAGLYFDSVAAAYVAKATEAGARLAHGQHGGLYFMAKFNPSELHELAIADSYLSWGWSHPADSKIKAVGAIKVDRKAAPVWRGAERLLLAGMNMSRYSYLMSSDSLILNEEYYRWCFRFVEALDRAPREALLIRLGSIDYGWDQRERWADRFPDIELDDGVRPIQSLLNSVRLPVYTYNGTGYLEWLAEDRPFVAYWNPAHSPVRAEAEPYFEALLKAGILHHSPESAATAVNGSWADVDGWWQEEQRQRSLAIFRAAYAPLSCDRNKAIAQELRRMATPRPADRKSAQQGLDAPPIGTAR